MHIGLIPDGNRRYGEKTYGNIFAGYGDSARSFRVLLAWCLEHSISHLSVFVFSTENFARAEKLQLFKCIERSLSSMKKDPRVAVEFLSCRGYRAQFPRTLRAHMNRIEGDSSQTPDIKLHLLMGYGGQCEIDNAILSGRLLTAHLPSVDFVLRTGDTRRLSNFLPYQSVYAELFFLKCMFPELQLSDLNAVMKVFKETERRFGR